MTLAHFHQPINNLTQLSTEISMDHKKFLESTTKVSNGALAQAIAKIASLLSSLEKQGGITEPVVSVICLEAARRLVMTTNSSQIESMKLVEDLSRRIYETITPENIALGHTWLKRKITEVIAAN